MKDIEFWFSLGSTYTYLTVSRIRKFQEKKDFNLIFRPFSVRDVMKSMDNIPFPESKKSKVDHMWRDIQRRSQLYGLEIPQVPVPYPIKDLDLANRFALVGVKEGWCLSYLEITYHLWFIEFNEAGSEENLKKSLSHNNLSYEKILDQANSKELIKEYQSQTENAIHKGVFGSPTFIVDGEVFWGDDRLEDAIYWSKL